MAAPVLAGRFGAGAVMTAGFVAMSVGAVSLTLTAQLGLVAVVASFGIYYLGIGPLMALGTDIVGRASERRAGSASAVSESTLELGLALGFALIGSLGTAVLGGRHAGTEVAPALPVVGAVVAATAIVLAIVTPVVLGKRAENGLTDHTDASTLDADCVASP